MSAKPAAYVLVCKIDGVDCIQWPACATKDEAQQNMSMYAEGDRKNMRVVPLYASSPAQARALAIADIARHKALINKAVNVLGRQLVPDGISDHEALNELHGIFDGPEYRALSPAPSVTEEWIEQTAISVDHGPECLSFDMKVLTVLATLAALGIAVEGAAK